MHFEDIKQETYCDIFSESFDQKLREFAGTVVVEKQSFYQFILKRAKEKFMQAHADWINGNKLQPGALGRILEMNIRIDCARELPQIIAEYREYQKSMVVSFAKNTSNIFSNDVQVVAEYRAIDNKCFRGGQTLLHIEASRGTLENVKKLVEEEKARTDIKDNSGMTPYQIAFQMDRREIANYLRNFAM